MPDYRAYIVGPDGHFYKSVALDALDDAAAIEAAKQLVDGHDVELWQLDRKIGKFEQPPGCQPSASSTVPAPPAVRRF